jgi:CBS domain-containing protein
MFLRSAAQMSYQQVLMRRVLGGEPVDHFIQKTVTTVPPDATVQSLVEDYVYRHHYKLYPVTREGKLLGCVSMEDIKQTPRDQWDQVHVQDIAKPCDENNTVRASDDAAAALGKMSRDGRSRLMVVDNGDLVGVLTLKDLLRFIALRMELEGNGHASKVAEQMAAGAGIDNR